MMTKREGFFHLSLPTRSIYTYTLELRINTKSPGSEKLSEETCVLYNDYGLDLKILLDQNYNLELYMYLQAKILAHFIAPQVAWSVLEFPRSAFGV